MRVVEFNSKIVMLKCLFDVKYGCECEISMKHENCVLAAMTKWNNILFRFNSFDFDCLFSLKHPSNVDFSFNHKQNNSFQLIPLKW